MFQYIVLTVLPFWVSAAAGRLHPPVFQVLGVNEPRFSNCFIEKRGSLYDPALGRHYHKDIAEKLSFANFTNVFRRGCPVKAL